MFASSGDLLLRVGACLIFIFGLMAAPNLRTAEILAEDGGHERSGAACYGLADLGRKQIASAFANAGLRNGYRFREGSSRRLRNIAHLAANSSGHLQSGHRLACGILAPQLL